MSDFSCLHGNERYGACDDASTGIASIGKVCGLHLGDGYAPLRSALNGRPLDIQRP